MSLVNSSTANMFYRAGRGFRAARDKDPAVEGAELANWLRSGAEITAADRELLAELVTGELRKRPVKSRKEVGSAEIRQVLEFYHEREAEYGPRQKQNAKADTIAKFNFSLRKLDDYLREERERAEAVKAAKRKVQNSGQ